MKSIWGWIIACFIFFTGLLIAILSANPQILKKLIPLKKRGKKFLNISKFMDEIDEVISEVEPALKEREAGTQGDGTVEELTRFCQNLKRIRDEIKDNNLLPKVERVRISSMWWFISDTWPLGSPLGRKIMDIERKYRELEGICILAIIHPKNHFDSFFESESFEKQLEELKRTGTIEEVSVKKPLNPLLAKYERWFRDSKTGEVYRYIPPEFPAKGEWEKLD